MQDFTRAAYPKNPILEVVSIEYTVQIWDYLKSKGLTDCGAAGLMGNLYAESGLNPKNLQNSFEKKLGYTDETYTAAVDSGRYKNFVHDGAGYGLAQWTFWSRKERLLNFCKERGVSIGDLEAQLDFLIQELTDGYGGLLWTLKSTSSLSEASNAVLLFYEKPADQSLSVQEKRLSYSQNYYDKFAGKEGGGAGMSNSPLVTYTNISPHRTSPRNHEIDTVTIHCYVGQVTAQQGCDYFATTDREASCNYVVGRDGSIGLCVEECDRSWCSSNRENDHRAITIEVASDTTEPYAVTEAAYEALIRLLVDICQRNPGIGYLRWRGDKDLIGQVAQQNMTVHRWLAPKSCPGEYLYSRHGEIAAEVNRRLGMEDDEMLTYEQWKAYMERYRKELQDNDCGKWSQDARDWSISTGLIEGGDPLPDGQPNYMWHDFLNREQAATLFYRYNQIQ